MFGFGKKAEDPAQKMVRLFTEALRRENIKFRVSDEKPSVFIDYEGDNFDNLTFSFFFDKDGASVALKVFSIVQFQKNQLPDAYAFCNEMNNEWRWIRFYVDSDDEFTADMDAVLHPQDGGEECVELLQRAVSIVDKVCGTLKS